MSKRRINKQQSTRIKKNQTKYHQIKQAQPAHLADGLVITSFSRNVAVEDNEGRVFRCSIRSNLETLVAGDRVIWQLEGKEQGVVLSLYPRTTILARVNPAGIKKPTAANISQMIIVIAVKPELSWPLLDSYLIMAETLNVGAVIVFNKIDLPMGNLREELLADYQPLGYPLIFTSFRNLEGYELLKNTLDKQVNVFVGQSGVGKSSLITGILPEETILTQELSAVSLLGRHTTSNSYYYHLPSGGALIDSPGVREFSLGTMDSATIAQGYREFLPLIPLCKYRNCLHINTPHCAIINALNQGLISTRRYDNFTKLSKQFRNSP